MLCRVLIRSRSLEKYLSRFSSSGVARRQSYVSVTRLLESYLHRPTQTAILMHGEGTSGINRFALVPKNYCFVHVITCPTSPAEEWPGANRTSPLPGYPHSWLTAWRRNNWEHDGQTWHSVVLAWQVVAFPAAQHGLDLLSRTSKAFIRLLMIFSFHFPSAFHPGRSILRHLFDITDMKCE